MEQSHLKLIARIGGKRRIELHGNPGTVEGRKRGGERSISTHRKKKTGFKTLKSIKVPRPSETLAELLGIFYGDGHVGEYQASVVTSSDTDLEHAHYIRASINKLFGLLPALSFRKDKNACTVLVSSKAFCTFMLGMGMPHGNKIEKGILIPSWVTRDDTYSRALLRGLIDTDGCVYQDRHRIKEKKYASTCIAFTSASPELAQFVYETLCKLGYRPTQWGRHVRLRRRDDVASYAKIVGFNNPKHARKIGV
jgi:intein/homing endonuclease